MSDREYPRWFWPGIILVLLAAGWVVLQAESKCAAKGMVAVRGAAGYVCVAGSAP